MIFFFFFENETWFWVEPISSSDESIGEYGFIFSTVRISKLTLKMLLWKLIVPNRREFVLYGKEIDIVTHEKEIKSLSLYILVKGIRIPDLTYTRIELLFLLEILPHSQVLSKNTLFTAVVLSDFNGLKSKRRDSSRAL